MTGSQPTGVLSAVAGRLGGPDTGEEQRQVDRVVREARYRDGPALHTAQAVRGGSTTWRARVPQSCESPSAPALA